MVKESYIKFFRSDTTNELLKDKSAFLLLTQIALRAKRTDKFNVSGLKIGEAMIGDYESIGLSRQNYRSAMQRLEKWKFITTKATNNGTIATICNTDIYDINISKGNQQTNHRATNGQPTANRRPTTNKNEKNDKNDKNENYDRNKKFKNYNKSNKERFRFDETPDYSEGL